MKLEQLRSFEAVARLGHFTHAAQELFLAQPSLSRQIAALESELGSELLTRGQGVSVLTHAGEVLLPIARRMLADAEAARRELGELNGLARGRVRLGAPPTLCVSVVAEVLALYRAAHPGVELEVMEAGSRDLVQALGEGRLDLALTVTRGSMPQAAFVQSAPLFTEELVVAASSAAGELPGGGDVTLAQLASMPQVAFNRSYDLRLASDAAFEAVGLTPTVAVEGAEMDAVLRFVERGIGVAVVPATILMGRPGLTATRLRSPSLTRTVSLSSRAGARLDAAGAAMERGILETTARLTGPGTELARWVIRAE